VFISVHSWFFFLWLQTIRGIRMRFLITAGPTREYIDTVRFISNASSGLMGFAVAAAAIEAGHEVTLLTGPVSLHPPEGAKVVPFTSVGDLASATSAHFDSCDVLAMAAAVGDFQLADGPAANKLSRQAGPVTISLEPTEDILATVAQAKRPGQIVVAFAVEDGPDEEAILLKARQELADKHADLSVVNTPAAFNSAESLACIIDAKNIPLPWAKRSKQDLARQLVRLISARHKNK
jgi:phosphopantothenoylcysteine decarboxylase/phosphopantothenate--cysteine ligase